MIDAHLHELHSCIGSLTLEVFLEHFAESDSDKASGGIHIISNIADGDTPGCGEPKVTRKAYALTRAIG